MPGLLPALHFDRQQQIIEGGHLEVERRLLIAAGDAFVEDGIGGQAADIFASEDDIARCQLACAGYQIDKGAFARAVGSDQAR